MAAQERHREFVAESLKERLLTANTSDLPFARRVARPLGRQLLRLSLLLLRYGKVETQPVTMFHHSSVGSIELN